MDDKYKLICPDCNSILELNVGYTGADWDCVAGDGSGYGWELSLDCTNNKCARIYPIGHMKEMWDMSPVVDKRKTYNKGNI